MCVMMLLDFMKIASKYSTIVQEKKLLIQLKTVSNFSWILYYVVSTVSWKQVKAESTAFNFPRYNSACFQNSSLCVSKVTQWAWYILLIFHVGIRLSNQTLNISYSEAYHTEVWLKTTYK